MKLSKLLAVAAIFTSISAQAIEVSFETDRSLPLVYINVAIKAGSVTDPANRSGLTNFMGEMLLRGTKTRTKAQIDQALDLMGARLEVETRAESMIIRGAALASELDHFLDLVKEIVSQPAFPDSEVAKLKAEIISGIREELGRDQTLSARRFTSFLFRGHPYGNPVLGKTKDIQALKKDDILAQYNRLIQDKYLLVVGAGDATSQQIETWSADLAKARPNLDKSEDIPVVATPTDAPSRRLLIVDKPDRTQTQIEIGQIGMLMTSPDYFPIYLGNYAFGGGSFSSRLMVEIRVKRGWSYGAGSHFRQGLKPRSWQVHLFPAAKDTPNALAYTLQLITDLKTKGVTPEEFNFSQRSLVNSSGFMYNTPQKRVENKLLERTLKLPDGFMKSYGPELQKVSYDQVNEALRKYLKPDQLTISVLGTAKDLKKALAQAALIPESQVQVTPYTQE